jgi:hypothetical protein
MPAYPRAVVSLPDDAGGSMRTSDHELTLTGQVVMGPKPALGRRSELRLDPREIRRTVLTWIALHPDEFGGALRAIVAEWNAIGDANTRHEETGQTAVPLSHATIGTYRRRLMRAATTEGGGPHIIRRGTITGPEERRDR